MTYQSISSYGIIGDMRSAALVSINGSIDWLCMPRFELAQRVRGDSRRGEGRLLSDPSS